VHHHRTPRPPNDCSQRRSRALTRTGGTADFLVINVNRSAVPWLAQGPFGGVQPIMLSDLPPVGLDEDDLAVLAGTAGIDEPETLTAIGDPSSMICEASATTIAPVGRASCYEKPFGTSTRRSRSSTRSRSRCSTSRTCIESIASSRRRRPRACTSCALQPARGRSRNEDRATTQSPARSTPIGRDRSVVEPERAATSSSIGALRQSQLPRPGLCRLSDRTTRSQRSMPAALPAGCAVETASPIARSTRSRPSGSSDARSATITRASS
jgi:hypothetical protein